MTWEGIVALIGAIGGTGGIGAAAKMWLSREANRIDIASRSLAIADERMEKMKTQLDELEEQMKAMRAELATLRDEARQLQSESRVWRDYVHACLASLSTAGIAPPEPPASIAHHINA